METEMFQFIMTFSIFGVSLFLYSLLYYKGKNSPHQRMKKKH